MSFLDKLEVSFKATTSEFDNCICSACHATERVVKVILPRTLYYDGKNLSTKYDRYWLCESCRIKLINALNFQEENVSEERICKWQRYEG